MAGQYIFGITGEIGTGKSFLSKCFLELGEKQKIETHHIDFDAIGHRLLEYSYLEIKKIIEIAINNNNHGRLWIVRNDGKLSEKSLMSTLKAVIEELRLKT